MMRVRLRWLKHCLGALFLLVFAAGALELGLRLSDPAETGPERAQPACHPLVVRCWLLHHRLRPLAAVSAAHPDRDATIEVRTNSYGLRGPEPAVPKPPGVYRIVCLGDETVLAADVAEPDTFCRRLEALLQPHTQFRVEVINAGVPDYCPLLSYLQARHVLFALQPDVLVLHVDMSDVADDHRFRRHLKTDDRGAPLACPHPELERPAKPRAADWLDRLFVARWCRRQFVSLPEPVRGAADRLDIDAREGRYAWLRNDPPDWSVYVEQALAPVAGLALAADQMYARLVVATCPAAWQVSPEASNGPGVRAAAGVAENAVFGSRVPFEILAAFAAHHAIPFCDASPAFQHSPQPAKLYLHNSPGLSEAGHELYARQIAACLLRQVPGVWIESPQPPYRPSEVRLDRTSAAEPGRP